MTLLPLRIRLLLLLVVSLISSRPASAAEPAPASRKAAIAAAGALSDVLDEDDSEDSAPVVKQPDLGEQRFWKALPLLRSTTATDLAQGRALLEDSATLEYSHGQVLLANCLLTGSYGFPKDRRKALELFRLAAERGNGYACASLGSAYATGAGAKQDFAKAEAWLTAALAEKADYTRPQPPAGEPADVSAELIDSIAGQIDSDPAESSRASAHFLLAQIYRRQKKSAESQAHFVAAATAGPHAREGIQEAAQQAAVNYAFGNGVTRDLAKANEMLALSRKLIGRLGARVIHNYVALKVVDEFVIADLEENVTGAGELYEKQVQYNIAQSFADKQSKEYNLSEAVKWYELAAENGQVWAMLSLGLIHGKGDLGQPDYDQAYRWFEKAGGGEKPRHFLGTANYALCLVHGRGVPADPAEAMAVFKQFKGDDIVCYLGTLGQAPAQFVTYEDELKLNQTWANEKKDAHAQYLMGQRYLGGFGVKADVKNAASWFRKAAKVDHAGAHHQLGILYNRAPGQMTGGSVLRARELAREHYKKASELGHAPAMVNYAVMMIDGTGGPEDVAGAIAFYEKALQIDPKLHPAHNNLGVHYQSKLHQLPPDASEPARDALREKMLHHYEAATAMESAHAAHNLARIYYDGAVLPRDFEKAYRYYDKAAEWHYGGDTHRMLGQMHEKGEGVPITPTEAAYHYRLAAVEGDDEALRRLINYYLIGKGGEVDLDRATFWLNQMARRGGFGSYLTMADILIQKGQHKEAVSLLKQLVDLDMAAISGQACERLSRLYRTGGSGVKANPGRAKRYFDRAIAYGDADALGVLAQQQLDENKIEEALKTLRKAAAHSPRAAFSLGQMYYFGTHVPKDEAKAIEHFRRAADNHVPEAMFFLGAMTFNRVQGAPSLDEAINYAEVAAKNGLEKAKALHEKLETRRKKQSEKSEENTRTRSS